MTDGAPLLSTWLTGRGHSAAQIGVALHKLRTEAANQNRTLYGNNRAVHSLLRYGVPARSRRDSPYLFDDTRRQRH